MHRPPWYRGSLPFSIILIATAFGCTSNPYYAYRASHPDWFLTLPSAGTSLEETIASLYEPGQGLYNRSVHRLELTEHKNGAWEEIAIEAVDYEAVGDRDFGIIAHVFCNSPGAGGGMSETISWYLLKANELVAWSHYDFGDRCSVWNEFRPAVEEAIPLEHALTDRQRNFSNVYQYTLFIYGQGLALARVGRLEDAELALARGDEFLGMADRNPDGYIADRSRLASGDDEKSARSRLVRAIEKARPSEAGATKSD
ncbi:MAG: hypothetical protein GY725_26845 [bacterium]|nr:hypothetical protein [bacterium]